MPTSNMRTMVRPLVLLILAVNLFGQDAGQGNNATTLRPVDMTQLRGIGGRVFVITDEEVAIGTDLVRRIEFGWGGTQITVRLSNQTGSAKKPDFKISFYNAYGMLIDSCDVAWWLDRLESSASYTETKRVRVQFDASLAEMFRHSSLTLPNDINRARYILISGSSY